MSAIEIGAKVDKDAVFNLAEFITTIFKSASENRMSDDVIAIALDLYSDSFSVNNINISSCNFEMKNNEEVE